MERWTRRLLTGATPLAFAVLAFACSGGDGGDNPPASVTGAPTATTRPEQALRRYVQNRYAQGFVASCEDAKRPDDVGKMCARYRGEREGLLAYELGPTFSEYTQLLILKQVGDTWTLEHQENRDPNEPAVPGIPWPLQTGVGVIVAGTGDCLRVRERPGLQAPEVTCLDDGTAVTLSSGPVDIDRHEWWQIEAYDGWAVSDYLRYPEEVDAEGQTPEAES